MLMLSWVEWFFVVFVFFVSFANFFVSLSVMLELCYVCLLTFLSVQLLDCCCQLCHIYIYIYIPEWMLGIVK